MNKRNADKIKMLIMSQSLATPISPEKKVEEVNIPFTGKQKDIDLSTKAFPKVDQGKECPICLCPRWDSLSGKCNCPCHKVDTLQWGYRCPDCNARIDDYVSNLLKEKEKEVEKLITKTDIETPPLRTTEMELGYIKGVCDCKIKILKLLTNEESN